MHNGPLFGDKYSKRSMKTITLKIYITITYTA